MPKVLIIEDRRENIVFVANSVLKPMGFEVITAMDGRTGLEKAMEEKPDLIITDLKLPRMGGLEVLEQLQENGYNIPSIVMTFHGTEETARRALRVGARDYLIKPFTIEEMQTALKRALQSVPGAAAPHGSAAALEQELKETRLALAEREDQLRRLSKVSRIAARVPELEREIMRLRSLLADRPSAARASALDSPEAEVTALKQTLEETRALLAHREKRLRQMQAYLNKLVKKTETAPLSGETLTWKEENDHLRQELAQAKKQLASAGQYIHRLEELLHKQKRELEKYRQQTLTLANELRSLSEAVRLLSQDLHHQTETLDNIPPGKH